MAGEADRSIGLIMPFSSAQMKALCLQAQLWTLRITLKAFFGCAGCVQCCGWGLYNLAALGNYKDKWREAQSITHPVRERGLRLGNFVFSKAALAAPTPHGFLVSHSLFLLLPCVLRFFSSFSPPSSLSVYVCTICAVFFSICFLSIQPLPSPPPYPPIHLHWCRGMEVFIYTSSAAQIALLPLCQCISIWNKKSKLLFAVTTYSMCFLAGFSVDLQVPNQCRRKMEIACSESSFPVNCLDCIVCLLTGVTESFFFLYRFFLLLPFVSFCFPACWVLICLPDSHSLLALFLSPVDDVPPYFKMEPPQTQVHLEGNRLVLTCMAEGSWPLEFKWIYNGTELTRFSLEYR